MASALLCNEKSSVAQKPIHEDSCKKALLSFPDQQLHYLDVLYLQMGETAVCLSKMLGQYKLPEQLQCTLAQHLLVLGLRINTIFTLLDHNRDSFSI